MSQNYFHGSIPAKFDHLKMLDVINIHNNKLEGIVPASLGKCTALSEVIFHRNQLTGSIPSGLGDLFLDVFDLRDNRMSGPIPLDLVDGNSGQCRVIT
jgi:Leucine-rich repeat (LRR) protein